MRSLSLNSLYTQFCSRILFPIHEWIKHHHSAQLLKQLEKTQWLSKTQIEQQQLEKLKYFLNQVKIHVPYYQKLFNELHFDPQQIRALSDLAVLPLLTKNDIRVHCHAMTSTSTKNLKRFNTGGSTGEPLIFYLSNKRISHDVAAKWRATRWWQVDIGDREMILWGSPVELSMQDRWRVLRDHLLRSRLMPAFDMSEVKMKIYIQALRDFQPRMLFGYPSALARLARYAMENHEDLSKLGISVAFVTAEKLYDEQRILITKAFNCSVANGYGSRDAGFIAHECPEGSMHISAEDIVLEIIDKEGKPLPPGHPGEIVITHLATSDFPFIRYRTGDIGIVSEDVCRCGRGLPILKEIQGRTTDFVTATDGTVMHGLALIYILRDMPGIAQFKIIQHSRSSIEVLIIPTNSFNQNVSIETKFQERLGHDMNVTVNLVNTIAPERSGKYRYVVSHVPA